MPHGLHDDRADVPRTHSNVKVPIIALGGTRCANGENVRKMAQLVAEDVGAALSKAVAISCLRSAPT
jgi:hypothetical protein